MTSFWLEYIQDGQRREFSFDAGSVTVGRDKTADFVLDHPTVSRQHAMIQAAPQGYQLVVLSRGGLTAIDGGQVQGENPLYDGSEIHFGQLSFTFRSNTAQPRPAGASPAMSGFGPSSLNTAPAAPQDPRTSGSIDWNSDGGDAGWGESNWEQAAAAVPSPAARPPAGKADSEGGIVTWDQIANSAEAQDDFRAKETDFQRIQAAQAKADAQTKGNNPLIIYGGLIGIIAVMAFAFWPKSQAEVDPGEIITEDAPFITWAPSDIDCVGRANCRAQALSAYKVGKSLIEQSGADISNPYEGYKQFDRAQKLLEKGGIDKLPDEMADVVTQQTAVKDGLDRKFQQARVNFREHKTRKMYKQMAGELNKLEAYFPDKRCQYNQWAVAKEREMKDNGIYPVTTLY